MTFWLIIGSVAAAVVLVFVGVWLGGYLTVRALRKENRGHQLFAYLILRGLTEFALFVLSSGTLAQAILEVTDHKAEVKLFTGFPTTAFVVVFAVYTVGAVLIFALTTWHSDREGQRKVSMAELKWLRRLKENTSRQELEKVKAEILQEPVRSEENVP